MTPWRVTPDGVVVACRLTPKGGRDAVDGVMVMSDGTAVLACRVRAPPEDGRANEALCHLIARATGAPASKVRILAGTKSRLKQVAVDGAPDGLAAALARLEASLDG
jgi:uncharacterized protein YggU (UPF0235/DUF167 family)